VEVFSIKGVLLLEVSSITPRLCIAKLHTAVYETSIQSKRVHKEPKGKKTN
jgi:hypothetical protein